MNELGIQYQQKIMNSKKKLDCAKILDELRDQDPKKRFAAVHDIKQLAAALGPARARTELISFLAQFIDDEENILLELLAQLDAFATVLGGVEHEKMLIPLLISFCKTDQKKVAFRSCQLIERVVKSSKEIALETIRKLMKSDMNVSKECALKLIVALSPLLEASEAVIIELYTPMFTSDSPQIRILASKYLYDIFKTLKGKEYLSKVLEQVYSEGGELEKIFALEALVEFYEVNNNFSLSKFKHLAVINSWRVNIKICQLGHKIGQKLSKTHFKLIFEPIFLKFMHSQEPELRSAACQTVVVVCKNMSDDEQKNKLLPIMKKMSIDEVEYVKVQLAKNIVPICSFVSAEFMKDSLLPIILNFIREPNNEIALGIAQHFEYLSTRTNKDVLDEKIIKPLVQQLTTNNWRNKCQIIKILKGFLITETYLNEEVLKTFIGLTDDRIDAVRIKANQLMVAILTNSSKDWCNEHVIPKVFASKQNQSYIKKQNLLDIIQKTAPHVSDKALKETYNDTILSYITDKVANVRYKTMLVIKNNSKLSNPAIEKHLEKLKEDKDVEIRDLAKKLRA